MGLFGSQYRTTIAAAPLAAALGCLQPGIDPVFLTLLSQASHVPLAVDGLIVGSTQAGAALGALAVWRCGPRLPHRVVVLAALVALACSIATVFVTGIGAILPVRCGYGVAMGMVYAYAMSAYTALVPNRAFGAVFLIQLILSTLVSLALPEAQHVIGASAALGVLALTPALVLIALLLMDSRDAAPGRSIGAATEAAVPLAGWALGAATFWFICATMLIWSFAAALATTAGIEDRTIGLAVALGSISGAMTALVVMRETLLVPLPVTALLAGASLVSPIVLIAPDSDVPFILSIILLNIGSTAIIIRCSSLAVATSTDPRFRTFIACTHSLGLIAGPVLGSVMIALLGDGGLLAGLLLALPAGFGAVLWAAFAGPKTAPARGSRSIATASQMALD